MTSTPIEKVREEVVKELWEKINEVRRETHWVGDEDSPTHYFGCKTRRIIDGETELFTITDWAHVETFFRESLQKERRSTIEECILAFPERTKYFSERNGFGTADYAQGQDAYKTEALARLEGLKKSA